MRCQPLCEVGNTCLCRGVCGNFGQRGVCIHRRNVENAAARLQHILGKRLRGQQRALEIEPEYKVNAVRVQIKKGLALGSRFVMVLVSGGSSGVVTACAVDKDVALAKVCKNLRVHLFKSRRIQHVCLVALADKALCGQLVGKLGHSVKI